MNTKRIFICEMLQESNSFNPVMTTFEDFSTLGIYEGDAMIEAFKTVRAAISGMVDCVLEHDFLPIGGIRMRAKSGGPVENSVVEYFIEKTLSGLKEAGNIDCVLVSLHGATLSDKSEDVCGDILEAIRNLVGQEIVISASCDLHANITEKMMRNADYICGYQTYPHIDHYNTGYRAAMMAVKHLQGQPAKLVSVTVPMMAPAHGYTTGRGSLAKLVAHANDMVDKGAILDFSVFQVQPWLDVKEIASSILIIAEDSAVARTAALSLAKEEFELRRELQGEALYKINDVIELTLKKKTDKPIVLVDSADSSNAGATGDSAAVLEKILPFADKLCCAVAVVDSAAVEKAFEIGVEGTGDFTLGASIAPKLSKSVTLKNAYVKSLHDGFFKLFGPLERGESRNLGKTAVLQVGKIMILISNNGQHAGDLNFYRSFGIEPTLCDLVCVKACTSLRAAYEPIAERICNTVTPGAACPVVTELTYEKLPKPFFPFEEIDDGDISEPKFFG